MCTQESDPSSLHYTSVHYAKEIVETLKPYAELKKIQPLRRLIPSVKNAEYCYLILEGMLIVHRCSDDRMIGTTTAPRIYGAMGMVNRNIDLYLKAITPVLIGKIPVLEVERLIGELNLWEAMTKYMMIQMEKLYTFNQLLTSNSAYHVVCAQLQELMREDLSIRSNTTAEMYIRRKTALSRSRVMHLLSDLKKGGYIEMKRGKLIKINSIPANY